MPRRRRPTRPSSSTQASHPLRILTQITLLQLAYYSTTLILTIFTTLTSGLHPSASQLFDWHSLDPNITTGWTLALCRILASFLTTIPVALLVGRSKLVPDFVLTIHGIDLIVVWVFSGGMPWSGFWWGLQVASVGLMCGLGIWACRWRELRPMAFGGKGKGEEGKGLLAGDQSGVEMVGLGGKEGV